MFLPMISIPKLGGDPELISLNKAVSQGTLDALSDLLLVPIVASRIEAPVADLDRIVDDLVADLIGYFPEAKTHSWHLVA